MFCEYFIREAGRGYEAILRPIHKNGICWCCTALLRADVRSAVAFTHIGFPYRYVGVVGVRDRGANDPKKRVDFLFFFCYFL